MIFGFSDIKRDISLGFRLRFAALIRFMDKSIQPALTLARLKKPDLQGVFSG